MSQYKEELWSNNYTVIPGFLDSCSAKELSDEFREFTRRQNTKGDNQVPQSESVYNYLPFLEMLCQKCPEVSIAIGETVYQLIPMQECIRMVLPLRDILIVMSVKFH